MKFKIIKRCDRCNIKGKSPTKIKRFNVSRHFPFYDYVGFDLCEKCEEDLAKVFDKFFNEVKK